jgi:transcriptional regulator with XRE-family HTH domain
VTSTHPAPDVGGRSTLEDVAARAGVSRATVSRVVNNSPQVSDAARRAVEAAIEVMGDAPNRAARSLAGHRSDTVALVVSEPSARLFADPFFAGVTLGITAALDSTPYLLVLLMSQSDTGRDRALRHLLRGGADGTAYVTLALLPGFQPRAWPLEATILFANYLFVRFNLRKLCGRSVEQSFIQLRSGAEHFFEVEGVLRGHARVDGKVQDLYLAAVDRERGAGRAASARSDPCVHVRLAGNPP